MKRISFVMAVLLIFSAVSLFAQTTNLPEWCNRVSEFADLTSSQVQSKFPAESIIAVQEQSIVVQQFPTQFSISVFSFTSQGRVSSWVIHFPSRGADLDRTLYEQLVDQFTTAYGNPQSSGTRRAFTGGLPEKAFALVIDIEQRGINLIWGYSL